MFINLSIPELFNSLVIFSGGHTVTEVYAPVDILTNHQGPDFDDKSAFFPCEIDDAIQCINLGYGAQVPKIVIL